MQPTQPMQQYMPPPPPAPQSGGGGGGLSKTLSVVATILAVVALAMTFVVPGPTGSQGPAGAAGANGSTGPQGPPGPGTVMSMSSPTWTSTINASCTNYAQVTITVPSAGTVVVHAQAWIAIEHAVGQWDLANLRISMSPTQCGLSSSTWPVSVPANLPTDNYFSGALLQNTSVVTAGTHTFYFNGIMGQGQSAGDQFLYANLVAVFYPS